MSLFGWGQKPKSSDYGQRAEKNAEDYLKKRFKTVALNRTLRKAPASHGPPDWLVINATVKTVALIQVKSSRYKGRARISAKEKAKLIETAKAFRTRAFLTIYERGHYTSKQLYPIQK